MATIAELIEELQKIEDKNRTILLEGCDCSIGEWSGMLGVYTDKKNEILLCRKVEFKNGEIIAKYS